ncbi:MAG: hypothetical protein EZS28_040037 [Streblomastix strix]|uniref:Uncharacterized protein n=1 Tax=Streblomastix strix TaxID=222440 RepID=A0A5J4U148_9EUKA|nr:MAG: hypothetical protein EZS28_040037 [Streblomastix strix]
MRDDPEIHPYEARIGLLGLINDAAKRQIYGRKFPYSLQQQLSETNIRITNEEQATDLGQSSFIDDVQPEISLSQEKLSEAQQQQIEADIISSVNLNTVYDIGTLDWGRPPINDIYGRQPFETYAAGYKYDQFGNPVAYMKKPTQPIGKKYNNMKKNYIPTSQLIQTAKAQAENSLKIIIFEQMGTMTKFQSKLTWRYIQ